MTRDPADDVCELWRNDTAEVFRMSPDDLQRKADRLDRRLRRGTFLLYAICTSEIVAFAYFFYTIADPIRRIGAALTIVGMIFLTYQVWLHRVKMRALTAAMRADPAVIFYRALLERSRDFHHGIWFWSRLLAIMPGPLVFMYGDARADPSDPIVPVVAAAFVLLGLATIPLNLWFAAGRFQRKLDALDRLTR